MEDDALKAFQRKDDDPTRNMVAGSSGVAPAKPAITGKTVTMVFPHKVKLQYEPSLYYEFEAGPQEVPAEMADHPYLKANKVVRYQPKAVEEPEPEEQEELEEVPLIPDTRDASHFKTVPRKKK